ncbi:uncharacterized protein DUF4190 [Neolewinella xylanilytica]|uniref:Uncharacterized protein DUF4190 n=1 Tax=Neolewinella xylanilytica TaxID=1514080 RepID=A0A2S6I2W7_9BACT|nr:DUF4190 domain-containing protein [Neolewinella xylanilytica]PPK85503.1 uncharacterized protein DUF4190 [Neolewinella xylanilytica]
MKHALTYLCYFLLFLLPLSVPAAIGVPAPVAVEALPTASLDRHDVEASLGRKLTFRERIALGIAKRQSRRADSAQGEVSQGNGMAVAGFVCGVVGLFVFGVILGPLAVVFSAIGLGKARREGLPLKGLAVAGLILGIVGTIGALIVIASL